MMITRTTILNNLIDRYGFTSYLEIGVRDAKENFDLINTDIKEGVDPDPVTPVKFNMTSDEFFLNHAQGKYDLIFVDGLHTAEQVYTDVQNSLNHLNEGGFIVLHDCNPPTEYHIRSYEEYLATRGQWNGTVFRGFIKLKQELRDWRCFVVDTDFGCGVVTERVLKRDFFPLRWGVNNIDWEFFDGHRQKLLDLITYEEFIELLKQDEI